MEEDVQRYNTRLREGQMEFFSADSDSSKSWLVRDILAVQAAATSS